MTQTIPSSSGDSRSDSISDSSWIGKIVAGAILLICCASAYWLGTFTPSLNAPNHGLVVDPAQLDFGEVWEEKSFPWELTIQNTNNEAVQIENFISSCGCLAVEPRIVEIPPKGNARVRLTLNLADKRPEEMDLRVRDFEVRLVPLIQGAQPIQQGWSIHGRPRSVLTVQPHSVDFGETLIHGQAISPRTVQISVHDPHTRVSASCDPSKGSVVIKKDSSQGTETFDAVIGPVGALPPGPFRFDVTLSVSGLNGKQVGNYKIPVEGRVVQEIQFIPEDVNFGFKNVGGVVKGEVVLKSRMGKSFALEGFEVDSPDILVEPLPAPAPRPKGYRITQRVTKEGRQLNKVKFLVRTEKPAPFPVWLNVSYYGMPKEMKLEPDGKKTN